jgi:hypothetical protein
MAQRGGRVPYHISYHLTGGDKVETVTSDTASIALAVIDELERLDDIVDAITAPDGRKIDIYELMIIANGEEKTIWKTC